MGLDVPLWASGLGNWFHENIEEVAAGLIAKGYIIGWFQGKAEIGPRALGNRSLLADPRHPYMKDIINMKVKKREGFRPFAPSVLAEKADEWFRIPNRQNPSNFMLIAYDVLKHQQELIPAVTHELSITSKAIAFPWF